MLLWQSPVKEVPNLVLTIPQKDWLNRLRFAYLKEVEIQARWKKGIRNPAGIVHNKIRHELTNYDPVHDGLNSTGNSHLLAVVNAAMREFVDLVIDTIPL